MENTFTITGMSCNGCRTKVETTLNNIDGIKAEVTLNPPIATLNSDNKIAIEPNILRKLNDYMSVRKGKFGPYVYYKRPEMKKPEFLNIKKFNEGFFACEVDTLVTWLCETYSLPEP